MKTTSAQNDNRTEAARDPASLTQMQPALNLNPAPLTQMRCSPPYRGHACTNNCSDHATIHEHENTCTPVRARAETPSPAHSGLISPSTQQYSRVHVFTPMHQSHACLLQSTNKQTWSGVAACICLTAF